MEMCEDKRIGREQTLHSLIIDDERDICFLLGNLLQKKHIESRCVNNIVAGRHILLYESFQLIILDNYLPDGEGMDLIPMIKARNPGTRLMFITAYLDSELKEKVHALIGQIDYLLLKPLEANLVNATIDHFLLHRNDH